MPVLIALGLIVTTITVGGCVLIVVPSLEKVAVALKCFRFTEEYGIVLSGDELRDNAALRRDLDERADYIRRDIEEMWRNHIPGTSGWKEAQESINWLIRGLVLVREDFRSFVGDGGWSGFPDLSTLREDPRLRTK